MYYRYHKVPRYFIHYIDTRVNKQPLYKRINISISFLFSVVCWNVCAKSLFITARGQEQEDR